MKHDELRDMLASFTSEAKAELMEGHSGRECVELMGQFPLIERGSILSSLAPKDAMACLEALSPKERAELLLGMSESDRSKMLSGMCCDEHVEAFI